MWINYVSRSFNFLTIIDHNIDLRTTFNTLLDFTMLFPWRSISWSSALLTNLIIGILFLLPIHIIEQLHFIGTFSHEAAIFADSAGVYMFVGSFCGLWFDFLYYLELDWICWTLSTCDVVVSWSIIFIHKTIAIHNLVYLGLIWNYDFTFGASVSLKNNFRTYFAPRWVGLFVNHTSMWRHGRSILIHLAIEVDIFIIFIICLT